MPFLIIINVFIYVGSICNTWILLKAESRCPDICCTHAQKLDFDGCKAHCKKHGAKRLTYFPWNYCLCCLDSSEIVPDTSGGKGVNVYECIENAGNCIYFPNWCHCSYKSTTNTVIAKIIILFSYFIPWLLAWFIQNKIPTSDASSLQNALISKPSEKNLLKRMIAYQMKIWDQIHDV